MMKLLNDVLLERIKALENKIKIYEQDDSVMVNSTRDIFKLKNNEDISKKRDLSPKSVEQRNLKNNISNFSENSEKSLISLEIASKKLCGDNFSNHFLLIRLNSKQLKDKKIKTALSLGKGFRWNKFI